jgi:DNA-binding beta-propeller fold protein YncE
MNARRLILAILCVGLGVFAVGGASAQAAFRHEYLSQLTGFGESAAVAVGGAGEVYVSDPVAKTVDRFSSSGAPLPFSATGSYVEGSKLIGIPVGTPEELKAFEDPDGVAVDDESGDVYVADRSAQVVDVFSLTGAYLSQLTGLRGPTRGLLGPGGLAVDQVTHNLYVTELGGTGENPVEVFSSAGVFLSEFSGGAIAEPGSSIGVNSLTEDAYAMQLGRDRIQVFDSLGSLVSEWDGTGTPNGSFGPGDGAPMDVTVDPTTQQVYVAPQNSIRVVDEFAASTFEEYEGQLTGTPSGPFTGPTAIAVSPLNGDLYVADGGVVDVFGPDINIFGATMQPPSSVTQNAAILDGRVDPAGLPVESCEFEYGATSAYGNTVPCEPEAASIGAGNAPVSVTGNLDLQPNTTYHYRLVGVENKGVSSATGDETLTTPAPPSIEGESATAATGKAGQTTVTLKAEINPHERETTYSFEYGETESYGASIPVPASVLPPSVEGHGVPITVELSGLKAGTTYHYRVIATNEYGSVDGADQQFTTVPAVLLEESVSNVAATSATLEAQLNPLGADTHYYFQYGLVSCAASPLSCTSVLASSGSDIGGGETVQDGQIHVEGLQSGVLYHYRVVAANALGTVEGPDDTFTTQAVGGVSVAPDGRAWEMVSPPEKHGGLVEPIGEANLIEAAADGGGFAYVTTAPTEAEPAGYANFVQVLATRGNAGWSSQDIATRHESATGPAVGQGFEYRDFSPDLSQALVEPQGLFTALSPQATEQTAYLRANAGCVSATGCYTPLVTSMNDSAGSKFGGGVKFVGATPDLTHVVLYSKAPLSSTPGDEGGLYEWAGGRLQLVSVLPADEGGSPVKPANASDFGSERSERNAISADGSRIVWSQSGYGNEGLYMRDTTSGETVRLDGSGSGAEFQTASSDGSRVFFTDPERLTADSHSRGVNGPDLYVCQMVQVSGKLACGLTDLTPEGISGESADVLGRVAGASEDGSYVYFVAEGALASGASAGSPNMYVAHDSEGKWTTRLIATLSKQYVAYLGEEDAPDWGAYGSLTGLTDRVSPDGRYFAFMSSRSLTGYDTRDAVSGQSDEEVYLYDAVSNKLVCASCDPTGARPRGIQYGNGQKLTGEDAIPLVGGYAVWREGNWLAANIPGWTAYTPGITLYQSRYLSDSGRLFFNSSDALVPQDVNGTEDVYEYEPPGIGDCSTSSADFGVRSGGCVGLISSGGGSEESGFVDASENGSEVFFVTSAKLLPQDFDTSVDIYDAHECSAQSPCVPLASVSPPVCTTGDACKAAPSPQPAIYGAPSSETFSGAGNLTPITPTVVKSKAKSLTRAQKLTKALKVCARMKSRKKRTTCEKQAKRAYGAMNQAKKTNRRGN